METITAKELELFVIILYAAIAVAFCIILALRCKISNLEKKHKILDDRFMEHASFMRYELSKTNFRCMISEQNIKELQEAAEDDSTEKEPKLYTFLEVIDFLKAGKKIRRHDRENNPDVYYQIPDRIRKDKNLVLSMHDVYAYDARTNHYITSFSPSLSDLTDKVFEVVE